MKSIYIDGKINQNRSILNEIKKPIRPTLENRSLNTNMRAKTDTALLIDDFAKNFNEALKDWVGSWITVLKSDSFTSDFVSGLTVAAVALPLNIALAMACSLPPITGFVAGLIGGVVAAVFGSSSLQVTGPSAALSFLVLRLYNNFGATGVAACCVIIGLIQIFLSIFRTGRLSRFIPGSVLAGFTTGVGLKILNNQIPDFLGFDNSVADMVQMMHRTAWLHEVSWISVFCGLFVATVVIAAKHLQKIPAALIGIIIVTGISINLRWNISKVGEIPLNLFHFLIPTVHDSQWLDLLIQAIPLAILASIEGLLSATAIDRISETKTLFNPNLELMGQGLANLTIGFFSGMPVSGAIARSSVNVQSGGKTRLASIFHAAFTLLSVVYLGQFIAQIPLAALAGLLCVVGTRLIELNTLIYLYRNEKVSAVAFLVTMIGSITNHLLLGLILGISIHLLYEFLTRSPQPSDEQSDGGLTGIRATLKRHPEASRIPTHFDIPGSAHNWLVQIREKSFISPSSFIHKRASVIGRVVLGENVHIAPESSVRADEGTPFFIGSNSNIQDGAVLHALKSKWVNVGGEQWAIFIGKSVSVAHQALVHGPCYIGDNSFIGFKSIIHDSIIGPNCYVGMGSIVVGVEIPDGRYVPHGMIVDTNEKARGLPPVTDGQNHFNEDVVDVNRGLAEAYLKNQKTSQRASTSEKNYSYPLFSQTQADVQRSERF